MTPRPPFVRPLPTGAETTDQRLELDPEVQRELESAIQGMRRARAAAEASGQKYLICG